MDDKFNTIAGWVLAAGIVALGTSIASGMYFAAHEPEKPGFEVADAAPAEGGGGAAKVDIATLLPTADPAKGAEVFKKCAACHTVTSGGANGIGPNLYATMGEEIGHGKGGFAFSDGLKAVGGSWDFAKMDAWLASPKKFAPGTKMTFAGLSKPEDRANLLVYLNAQGSNLPLPAAAAAPAADAAAPADNAAEPANGAAPAANAAAPEANAAAPAAK